MSFIKKEWEKKNVVENLNYKWIFNIVRNSKVIYIKRKILLKDDNYY